MNSGFTKSELLKIKRKLKARRVCNRKNSIIFWANFKGGPADEVLKNLTGTPTK